MQALQENSATGQPNNEDLQTQALSESSVRIGRLFMIAALIMALPISFLLLYATAASYFLLSPVTVGLFLLFLYLLSGYIKISKRGIPWGGSRTIWVLSFLLCFASLFCLLIPLLSFSYDGLFGAGEKSIRLGQLIALMLYTALIYWFFLAIFLSAKAFFEDGRMQNGASPVNPLIRRSIDTVLLSPMAVFFAAETVIIFSSNFILPFIVYVIMLWPAILGVTVRIVGYFTPPCRTDSDGAAQSLWKRPKALFATFILAIVAAPLGIIPIFKPVLGLTAFNGDTNSVRVLTALGAGVNSAALYCAAKGSKPETIKYLLKRGADVNGRLLHDETPLMALAQNSNDDERENIESAKLLLGAGADIKPFYRSRSSILLLAVTYGKLEIAKLLLDAGADANTKMEDGFTVLMSAVGRGDIDEKRFEIVKLLIKAVADINGKNKDGATVLMFASQREEAVFGKEAETVNFLLQAGADVNAKNVYGETALMKAVNRKDAKVVKTLITAGADVNAKTKDGKTALYYAESNGPYNAGVIELLKSAGAAK